MKTLYLDNEYRLHTRNNDYREIETDLFDNYCDQLIECMRYIPQGETYTKSNGITLHGEFIQPFKSTVEADKAQIAFIYSKQIASLENDLASLVEDLYSEDLAKLGGNENV